MSVKSCPEYAGRFLHTVQYHKQLEQSKAVALLLWTMRLTWKGCTLEWETMGKDQEAVAKTSQGAMAPLLAVHGIQSGKSSAGDQKKVFSFLLTWWLQRLHHSKYSQLCFFSHTCLEVWKSKWCETSAYKSLLVIDIIWGEIPSISTKRWRGFKTRLDFFRGSSS